MSALRFLFCFAMAALGGYGFHRPEPVRLVQAVEFKACGSVAGILVTASDGTSAWYQPPFLGLEVAAGKIPEDAQFSIDHCPSAL